MIPAPPSNFKLLIDNAPLKLPPKFPVTENPDDGNTYFLKLALDGSSSKIEFSKVYLCVHTSSFNTPLRSPVIKAISKADSFILVPNVPETSYIAFGSKPFPTPLKDIPFVTAPS